jgi:hypothetical protein
MSPLTIRIKKGKNGPHSLVCTRVDGSMTMQHQRQDFFPMHDLIHYAVESVLGYRRGFFGLVAEGWDLSDFGTPWPRGPLPPDMDPAELIVGMLGLELGSDKAASAEEVNARVAHWHAEHAPDQAKPERVSDNQLTGVRDLIAKLHGEWRELNPGEAIDLRFPPDSAA